MSYLTALGCVLAIVGIVVVGGVIIAFLANTVINVFAADSRVIKDESRIEEITSAAYTEPSNTYQNVNNVTNNNVSSNASEDFDYFTEDDNSVVTDVNNAIAREEEKLLKNESNGLKVDEKKESPLDFEDDDDFFADFNKPKETKSESKEEDDFDIMSMVDEISKDVLDDKANEVKTAKPEEKSILDNYSIDSILNNQDEIEEEDEEDEEEGETIKPEPVVSDASLEEMRSIKADILSMLEELKNGSAKKEETANSNENVEEDSQLPVTLQELELQEAVEEKIDENLEIIEELKTALAKKEEEIEQMKENSNNLEAKYSEINKQMVDQFNLQNREMEEEIKNQIKSGMSASLDQINTLKTQLAELTKQLEEERSMNWKVAETPKSDGSKEVAPVNQLEEVEETKTIKVVENNVIESNKEDDEDEDSAMLVEKEDLDELVSEEVVADVVEEEIANKVDEQLSETTEAIKALTKQVEEVVNEPVVEQPEEVKYFHYSTEDQYLERIAVLEERLRVAKKDLKTNDREFKPLEKVKKTLARDKAKLRRKQAIAAKKKVALYGVNNYVDLDKEKAEKLMRELDLLEGLKLSVSHCEEVMTANADRYPILEHTHNILTNNINDIEADIASLNKELKALRDKNGSDKK